MTRRLSARVLPAPLLLLCAVASPAARAETLYVIEQLVVSVNSAPDSGGERIASVRSGDALEVLERSGDQVHVRTAGGKEGWIRASYLSAEEPLRQRLAQRTAEVAQLKEQVSRLQLRPHISQSLPVGRPAQLLPDLVSMRFREHPEPSGARHPAKQILGDRGAGSYCEESVRQRLDPGARTGCACHAANPRQTRPRIPSVTDLLWRLVPADFLADPGTGPPTYALRGFIDHLTKSLDLGGDVEQGNGQRLFGGQVADLAEVPLDRVTETPV